MRHGMTPTAAAEDALSRIAQFYPNFTGALVAVNITGSYGQEEVYTVSYTVVARSRDLTCYTFVCTGAANHGFGSFSYTVYTPQLGNSTVIPLP